MAALTAVKRYSMRPGNGLMGQNSYIVKNGVKIYHGALVGTDPNTGNLMNWQQSSGAIRFKGVAMPRGARSTAGAGPSGSMRAAPAVAPRSTGQVEKAKTQTITMFTTGTSRINAHQPE